MVPIHNTGIIKLLRIFATICQAAAEWNFFATSHGKSLCDDIGGTVKSLVANSSLWFLKEPTDLPGKMFMRCKNNIKGVGFLFVTHSDIKNHVSELKLEQRYEI